MHPRNPCARSRWSDDPSHGRKICPCRRQRHTGDHGPTGARGPQHHKDGHGDGHAFAKTVLRQARRDKRGNHGNGNPVEKAFNPWRGIRPAHQERTSQERTSKTACKRHTRDDGDRGPCGQRGHLTGHGKPPRQGRRQGPPGSHSSRWAASRQTKRLCRRQRGPAEVCFFASSVR